MRKNREEEGRTKEEEEGEVREGDVVPTTSSESQRLLHDQVLHQRLAMTKEYARQVIARSLAAHPC